MNAVRHNTTENVARLVCDSSVSVNYSSSSDSPEDYDLSDPEAELDVGIKCSVSSMYFGNTDIESTVKPALTTTCIKRHLPPMTSAWSPCNSP